MLVAKKKKTPWCGRFKELRARHGLTQAQAAARIGVATRTLIAWENGQRVPGRLALNLLKAAFPNDF